MSRLDKGGSRTAPTGSFCRGQKQQPPIIGATSAFDAKIYKIVDSVFDVSACEERDKKNFKIFDFCSQLPSLLVDFFAKIYFFCGFFLEHRRFANGII